MQKGDFRNTAARQAELERREELREQRRRESHNPMTQAQGERIIELLEQLVANGTPGSPAFNEALDKAIGNDLDYRNGFPK